MAAATYKEILTENHASEYDAFSDARQIKIQIIVQRVPKKKNI